jgi:tetratricopeptide (TPR) repeat protein
MRIWRHLLAATILSMAAPGLAGAETAEACYQSTLNDDDAAVVRTCTAAIRSGRLSGNTLATTHNNRCLGYLRQRQFDQAIADCNEALRLNPRNVFALDNRGDVHRERGEYGQALRDYTAAIAIDGTFVAAYINRAQTYERLGRIDAARDDLNLVLSSRGDREIDKWARRQAETALQRLNSSGKR